MKREIALIVISGTGDTANAIDPLRVSDVRFQHRRDPADRWPVASDLLGVYGDEA